MSLIFVLVLEIIGCVAFVRMQPRITARIFTIMKSFTAYAAILAVYHAVCDLTEQTPTAISLHELQYLMMINAIIVICVAGVSATRDFSTT